ncbi:hypothetical protein AGMMS49975_05280 [Clostridia bacterium]|nr:hypothetical protein AGMMS49975_05280 [Clostridia bacterium]
MATLTEEPEFICDCFYNSEPKYNARTMAAIQEARDIMSGKIQTKKYYSVAELMEDLNSDVDD